MYLFSIPSKTTRDNATSRKIGGSIPDVSLEFFIDIILPTVLWSWRRLSLQ